MFSKDSLQEAFFATRVDFTSTIDEEATSVPEGCLGDQNGRADRQRDEIGGVGDGVGSDSRTLMTVNQRHVKATKATMELFEHEGVKGIQAFSQEE